MTLWSWAFNEDKETEIKFVLVFFHLFWFVLNYRPIDNSHVVYECRMALYLWNACLWNMFQNQIQVHKNWGTVFTEVGELCSMLDMLDMVLFGQISFEIQLLPPPPPFYNVIYWKICIIGDTFTKEIRFHTPEFLTVRELLDSSQQWIDPSV